MREIDWFRVRDVHGDPTEAITIASVAMRRSLRTNQRKD
jgi:hypothetical protein